MTTEAHSESYHQDQALELGLKFKTEFELYTALLESTLSWPQYQQEQFWRASEIVRMAHRMDRHKNTPYIYHLLRTANRIVQYLKINDPDVVIAAVLHDVVEDHPMKVVASIQDEDCYTGIQLTPAAQQEAAIVSIEMAFSSEIAQIVALVTNVPNSEAPREYEEKLRQYVDKIEGAIEDMNAWIVKFSDWCDNGVGIYYDAQNRTLERTMHFKRKYGMVLPILEKRFLQQDLQSRFNSSAKEYIARQFQLGRERLIVEDL